MAQANLLRPAGDPGGLGWCHSIRGDTGYLPSETRFKAIHGTLGRRRPRQLLLHCSRQLLLHCSTFAHPWARTSCIPAVVSAHGLREQVPHIPANGGGFKQRGFDQQESITLSGDMGGVRPETLRDRTSRMSLQGRTCGASQGVHPPCRRGSVSTQATTTHTAALGSAHPAKSLKVQSNPASLSHPLSFAL
jgi:hypothetical protein